MRKAGFFFFIILFSGCALNSTRPVDRVRGQAPRQRAIVIVGIADNDFDEGQHTVRADFDQFSIQDGRITGNCSRYNRLESERRAVEGRVTYFAFDAPAGYYILSPFGFFQAKIDSSALAAFATPPGVVSYLGDFHLTDDKQPATATVTRRENLKAANKFARDLGLTAMPVVAPAHPIGQLGGGFLCTP